MKSFCLNVSRFALAAWLGAATIFVITAVHEARSPDFTSTVKSDLALLRFPTYYVFGFTLVPLALIAGLLARKLNAIGKWRMRLFYWLLVAALLLMIVDYVGIYQPLAGMLKTAEAARPANFQTLHQASKYINAADVGLCLIAALLINLPGAKRTG